MSGRMEDGRWEFEVWAPFSKKVELRLISPEERVIRMKKDKKGYWRTAVDDLLPGARYFYRLDGEKDRADPASHFQPEGVHGASQIVDHGSFHWSDSEWKGKDLFDFIIYELHTGSFTPEGTFEAIIPRLDELKDTGINAIELMPLAQFPGERNWGYDGVFLFSVQNSYGGPDGLKRLVNECHKKDIAVILDVVYNHLGPEGNHLSEFGPYFAEKYRTPWGQALNFEGAFSDEVRRFFFENALHWFENYHIDALRLDAIHAIFDMSATPFLQELAQRVGEFSRLKRRKFHLIAESNLNDPRVMRPEELGGFAMDAQWCDDFHHSLHALLTVENKGYYIDFGKMGHLVKSLREGFVYSGQYSRYRNKSHGSSSKDIPANRFIVFSQNHDQTGNRMLGERLSSLVPFEAQKLAAGVVLLSPYIPLLFMGEEYGEESPFLYFISHSDTDLIEAVRKGRKNDFRSFHWKDEPPDPQSAGTFLRSKLCWEKRKEGKHAILLDFYRNLIMLRKTNPALCCPDKENLDICGFEREKIMIMRRWKGSCHVYCFFNFNPEDMELNAFPPEAGWEKLLDSSDAIWNGPGTFLPEIIRGHSFAVFMEMKDE